MALFEMIESALKAAKTVMASTDTRAGRAYLHQFIGGGKPVELALTDVEKGIMQRAAEQSRKLEPHLWEEGFQRGPANTLNELGIEAKPTRRLIDYGSYPGRAVPDPASGVIDNPETDLINTFGRAFVDIHPKGSKVFDLYKFYPSGDANYDVQNGISIGNLIKDVIERATDKRDLTPPLQYVGVKHGKPYVITANIDTTPAMAQSVGQLKELGMITKGQAEFGNTTHPEMPGRIAKYPIW